MGLPEHVVRLAKACNLDVYGWDDQDDVAAIRSADALNVHRPGVPVVDFIGSKAECVAYLKAWQQAIEHKLHDLLLEQETGNGCLRQVIMPLASYAPVEPGGSAQITIRPQRGAFRGSRMAIPLEIALRFEIDDLRVGNRSQLEIAGSIPGEMFAIRGEMLPAFELKPHENTVELTAAAEREFGRRLPLETCMTAQDLTMSVSNRSESPSRFVALILGHSASL